MRRKLVIAAGSAFGTLAMLAGTTAPANAATEAYGGSRSCATTGAYGTYSYDNYHGPDATITIRMSVSDTMSDGNSVRVRMTSKDTWGTVKYWQWHSNANGNGTTSNWTTTASDSSGLFSIGIQVARINTDGTIRNSCTSWI
ncbi:hypothetical protein ABZ990_30680 [Streptomyces sp. NPDC046203]|uniref:hypothetical protein n=1 Tax=Streptomyces sp. NPDC046203 TaxID=3154602 RepID=UPI0033ECA2CD